MNTSLKIDKDGNIIKFFRSENYNYYFNLNSGMFYRWGKKLEDDPSFSPFGPEIFDCEISTICNKGCSYCFVEGTMIETDKGKISIEQIKKGDKVKSFSEKQGIIENLVEET